MAHIVRELPVLEGEDARFFYQQAAKMKVSKSKEEVQESFRQYKIFEAEQERLHPRTPYKKHLTTKERIDAFGSTMDDVQVAEFDWGKPQGIEVW